MNPFNNPDAEHVRPGDRIITACGSTMMFMPGTESAIYNGKTVYFCVPACKKDFERDPRSSCLALSIT
jgi:YHS domain-containing protein